MSVQYFKTVSQSALTGVAVTVGPVEWIMPFPGQNARVLFRQRFQQDIGSYSALTLNTAHGVSTTYLLVKEDDFSAIGGGQHQWYRHYACTPPARTEYVDYAAQYPGYRLTAVTIGRDNFPGTTQAKVTTEYFLVGSVLPTLSNASSVTFTDGGSAPLLSGVVYLDETTTPTRTTYQGWVTTDAGTASSFSLTAAPQTISRWEGNFYARTTINVKAR